jgi:hypothetical protein
VAAVRVSGSKDNLDIDLKGIEDGDEPVRGVTDVAAIHELGNIGLTDAKANPGLGLGEAEHLESVGDLPRQGGLELKFFGVLETQVRENIPAASCDRNVQGSLSRHTSLSFSHCL